MIFLRKLQGSKVWTEMQLSELTQVRSTPVLPDVKGLTFGKDCSHGTEGSLFHQQLFGKHTSGSTDTILLLQPSLEHEWTSAALIQHSFFCSFLQQSQSLSIHEELYILGVLSLPFFFSLKTKFRITSHHSWQMPTNRSTAFSQNNHRPH